MRTLRIVLVVLCAIAANALLADEAADLLAAKALFDKNLDAIRHRDRANTQDGDDHHDEDGADEGHPPFVPA